MKDTCNLFPCLSAVAQWLLVSPERQGLSLWQLRPSGWGLGEQFCAVGDTQEPADLGSGPSLLSFQEVI